MAKSPKTPELDDDTYSDDETARRRDQTLKRMLNTPPKPHKPKSDDRIVMAVVNIPTPLRHHWSSGA